MTILAWIVVGLIAGLLAHLIVGGRAGILGNMFLGILGAVVAGFLAPRLGIAHPSGINFETIAVPTLGAVLVLVIWHLIAGPRRWGVRSRY